MTGIQIRKAQIADASEIGRINTRTWQFAYRGLIPDAFLDALSVDKRTEIIKRILDDADHPNTILVAVQKEQIIGFCNAGPCRDNDMDNNTGEIVAIYVDPHHMGKGAGSALMASTLDLLRKSGFIRATLWVLTSNDSSRKWYEHRGWQIEGKIKVDKRDTFELHETRYIIDLNK